MKPSRFADAHYSTPVLLLAVVLLASGCSKKPTTGKAPLPTTGTIVPSPTLLSSTATPIPSLTPSLPPQATPIPSLTLSLTPQATPTPLPPSPTPTVAPTPTIPPEARLNIRCLQVAQELAPGTTLDGTLILDRRGEPDVLWNLETIVEIPLPDGVLGYAISPDGRWAAYIEFGDPNDWIRIMTADGQIRHSVLDREDWLGIGPWLDNDHLLIDRIDEPLNSTIVLNPFTGQWREFLSDYPDIYFLPPHVNWGEFSLTETVYNPGLTEVVYPHEYLREYVLWNLQTRRTVARIPSGDVWSHTPRWSPDGEQFVFASPQREPAPSGYVPDDELFSASRDGQVTQLTHLSAYFTSIDISLYSWSPDGRYIAFWVATNYPQGADGRDYMELALLEESTQKVTLYCIKGDFRRGGWQPVWSPNSQQIMVKSLSESSEGRIVLVDIARGFAVQVADDVRPVGWMASVP